MQTALAVKGTVGDIVDANDAWERHNYIVELRNRLEQTFLELAAALYQFKKDETWKALGYASFNSYLGDPDVDISVSTADKLILIHRVFCVNLSCVTVTHDFLRAGWAKLALIAPHVDRDNAEEWLDKAASLSRSDLWTELRSSGMAVHYSSDRLDWGTPWLFFNQLDAEFDFTLDVCATEDSAKCKHFFSPEDDGLSQTWTGVCWMNPPYGDEIGYWVEKAYRESRHDALVVCLVPSRTDTAWWHDYVMKAKEIRFVRGRLRFEGAESSAPFPSAVVVFESGFEGLPLLGVCIACND